MQNPSSRDKNTQQLKIVVVGGSAAGLKAACRARRLLPNAEVTVVETSKYISYAACGLPYYLSGEIGDFENLIKTNFFIFFIYFFFFLLNSHPVSVGCSFFFFVYHLIRTPTHIQSLFLF